MGINLCFKIVTFLSIKKWCLGIGFNSVVGVCSACLRPGLNISTIMTKTDEKKGGGDRGGEWSF